MVIPPMIGEIAAAVPESAWYLPKADPLLDASTDSATSVFETLKKALPRPESGSAIAEMMKLFENANTKIDPLEMRLEITTTFFLPMESARAPAGAEPSAAIVYQTAKTIVISTGLASNTSK